MTPCLRPEEYVDLIDGRLAPGRRAHVDRCPACQALTSGLAEALRSTGEDVVPEPPAHFWPSVNEGVAARIDERAGRPWHARLRWPFLVPAAATATALLVLAVSLDERPVPSRDTPVAEAPLAPAGADRPGDDDAALALIADLSSGLPDGGWEPLTVGRLPDLGTAATLLSSDEQEALAALLRSAVDRPES